MGTYRLSKEEISEILEDAEENGKFQGDFSEADLMAGAKLFVQRLRKQGAYIPKK